MIIMRGRWSIVTAVVALSALALHPVEVARAQRANALMSGTPNGGGCGSSGTTVNCPTQSGDGYVYVYDPVSKVYVPVPTSGPSAPAVQYRYFVTPACPNASPNTFISCAAAATYCATIGQSGMHELIWRMETAPLPGNWQLLGDECTGTAGSAVPLQQVLDAVGEYERDHMPVPQPVVQPDATALVNLPVIVSVPDVGQQTMNVQLPVPGELVAVPTYVWTFDDGTTLTGTGNPFDGTDPRTKASHYLAHTYSAAHANASVTLTVTWNATFTAAGQTFALPQLVMPPLVHTFSVHEARSVLVTGH